jgi:multiple sugar transport system substrate-binding protein
MGSEGEYVRALSQEFERRNPGVKIIVQSIPWTAAQEKLITAYASDNTPDGFQLGNTWVPQFVALNAIEDLDDWVSSSKVIKKDKYFEGIWDTNVMDGSVYGIPWYVDTRLLFYRKDIFERAGYKNPPKTWDELLDLSRRIRKLYGNQEKYAIYLPTNEWAPFVIFGMQNGSDILKDNASYGDFSGEKFKEAFTYLVNFHKENLAPIGITQVTNVYQALADGYFSMYISGPWNIPEFKKNMKGDLADAWLTAPLPSPDSSYPGLSLAGGASLVMSKTSKKKELVWKFFEFLSERETQLQFYHLLFDLPAVKDAWTDSSLIGDKYIKAFYQQFQKVAPTPKAVEWEQIAFAKVQQYAELAARGSMTIDAALAALDVDVNKILEKRRWLLSKREN